MEVKYLIYLGLMFSIVFSSCRKVEDNPIHIPCTGDETISYIESVDLQNCMYKINSYWVYIDSVNNSIDSVYIDSLDQGFIKDFCGNSYEMYYYKTISSYSSMSTDYVVFADGLFKTFNGLIYKGIQIYDDFDMTSSMTNYQIEKFDSLLIYDQYYKRVLRVEIENDEGVNNNKSIYFINSEFGFLRHEIYSDNILTSNKILIRKNIER